MEYIEDAILNIKHFIINNVVVKEEIIKKQNKK